MANGDLLNGIALIIDDEIYCGDIENAIVRCVADLEGHGVPSIQFDEIPSDDIIRNLSNVDFIILDWDIEKIPENPEELDIAAKNIIERVSRDNTIKFIKKIQQQTFIPIFIYSQKEIEDIKECLVKEELYFEGKENIIFVVRKASAGELLTILSEFITKNSSAYVLKQWEKSMTVAKNKLFWSFFKISPAWPRIYLEATKKDGVNIDSELGLMITRNIVSRIDSYGFEEAILENEGEVTNEDILKVLEGERYITGGNNNYPNNGDIYFMEDIQDDFKYYLNIRPQCDCIRGDAVEVYCLRGREAVPGELRKNHGHFLERVNNVIVYGICDGKIMEFNFKKLIIEDFSKVREKRIGRLLDPHMQYINKKYSFYLLREGLPSLPDIVLEIYPEE